ncbi:MAG: hypothetical protein KDI98_00865 [Hyphomicrobiaceae bacterium]|nr:hypothetical protein [Hyphomicrobiaceae bacterium]
MAKLVALFIIVVAVAIIFFSAGPESLFQGWRESHPVQDVHERGGR